MADVTLNRIGELLRSVLELLWTKPEGMPAGEILAYLPEITRLTEYERGYAPPSNMPRYERMVRLATIPLVKAGWLVKSNKGRWFITEEGRHAARRYSNARELYKEALRLFEETRQSAPQYALAVEEAEEKAWEQIHRFLLEIRRTEFRYLVAELLRAMGYHVAWVAPPEKDHGQIDLVANVDPIGKTILVGGHEFEVIGTMLRPAASFFGDTAFRVTRNFDLEIDEEEAEDLLQTIQQELRRRERGNAVRLEVAGEPTPASLEKLV